MVIVWPRTSTIARYMSQSSQPKFFPRYLDSVLAATNRAAMMGKTHVIVNASVCLLSTIS
jgi:hypothetical protein